MDKYGAPARVGPNMVVYDDPEIYRAASAPRSLYRRGEWYKGMQLDPRIDNLLSERDEKRHTELRSKMLHAVSIPAKSFNISTDIFLPSTPAKMSQIWKQ